MECNEDIVDLVDDSDRMVGRALRCDCHGNPQLIHRAVHVLVFNAGGQLLLQKRSHCKDIQPGKWDTSVGGHLDLGEGYATAAAREMYEELGFKDVALMELYRSKIRNSIESENIQSFLCIYNGVIRFAADEIDEVRFWNADEINATLGCGHFTPNFEEEWQLFYSWLNRYKSSLSVKNLHDGRSIKVLFRTLLGVVE